MTNNVGELFYVKSGCVNAGQVGECIEELTPEEHMVMFNYVKLSLDEEDMWYKLSEVGGM